MNQQKYIEKRLIQQIDLEAVNNIMDEPNQDKEQVEPLITSEKHRTTNSQTVIRMGMEPIQFVIDIEEAGILGMIEKKKQTQQNIEEEIHVDLPEMNETLRMKMKKKLQTIN